MGVTNCDPQYCIGEVHVQIRNAPNVHDYMSEKPYYNTIEKKWG